MRWRGKPCKNGSHFKSCGGCYNFIPEGSNFWTSWTIRNSWHVWYQFCRWTWHWKEFQRLRPRGWSQRWANPCDDIDTYNRRMYRLFLAKKLKVARWMQLTHSNNTYIKLKSRKP